MTRRTSAIFGGACAALAATALAACSADHGPLSSSDVEGVDVCVEQDPSGRVVIAQSMVSVSGEQDVTVTAVRLVEPDGIELIGHEFGYADDFASFSEFAVVGGDYDTHGPSEDPVTILRAGRTYVVKVGLAAGAGGGRADAVAIDYRIQGAPATHTERTRMAMEVAAVGDDCPGA